MNDTTKLTETDKGAERVVNEPRSWITIEQLQRRYGIGRTAAYAWAHRLPNDVCLRIGAKKLLVNEPKLIAYLEQKGTRIVSRPNKAKGRR
jgi:hypothetical protein